jgi:acyl-CoA synthetase (AMP-forming)/AMP-acid ligase II
VPSVFAVLLGLDLSKFDLSSLRFLTSTGALFPSAHILALRKLLPRVQVYSMYGLTECKRALYLPPEDADRKPHSVGIPIPGTRAWVEDENGRPVSDGTIGELVVSGSHVTKGYWRRPEATAAVFRESASAADRALRTGDLFVRDDEGYFRFVGRRDDMFKSGGQKVSPRELEDCICGMAGIREAAILGVPDSVLGQAIKAFVVATDPRLRANDVLRHCKANLEDYKVPAVVEIVDALPKTANGKIDRAALSGRNK